MNAITKMFPKMSATDLSAIILKGASMSPLLERDAGFCSGGSSHEDDLMMDQLSEGLHSPTDTSEDSVEVKVMPISKNKRKSTEPLRVISDAELMGPLKKRIRYEEHTKLQIKEETSTSPFRPWAPASLNDDPHQMPHNFQNPADLLVRHPGVTTLHRAIALKPLEQLQQQPLALVSKKQPTTVTKVPAPRDDELSNNTQSNQNTFVAPPPVVPVDMSKQHSNAPRNYKNMTRERRIEANARERTRVHTISAAYDKLRKAVPAYSNSQKLSKLSILRIACSYILTLSRMSGDDYSEDGSQPEIIDCVEAVSKTIQTEGKLRKKKEE